MATLEALTALSGIARGQELLWNFARLAGCHGCRDQVRIPRVFASLSPGPLRRFAPRGRLRRNGRLQSRGVEAYRCLSKTPSRARYDKKIIAKGKLRLDASAVSVPPPPIALRTLEALARTPRGKALALKADRLIAIGQLEAARVALVAAMQCEPGNDNLSERLEILYEALALEPL